MAFSKKTWVVGDVITADLLNRLEQALSDHDTNLGDLTGLTTTNKGNIIQAINEIKGIIPLGGGSGSILTYNTLTDLQTAYPNGTTQPVWVVADQEWYYWSGTVVTPPADTTPPNNVTNLTTSNVSSTTLTLLWAASTSSDIASYDVYQGATLLGNTTQATYNVSGLTATTSYTFTIKAKDSTGNISTGVSVTQTTTSVADTTAPANVTNLVTSNITATGTTLTWTASTSSDTVGYDIYNGATLITTVTGTTYNATGLTQGTAYTFTVKAKDGAGNIATGTSVNVTTTVPDTTPPNPVTSLAIGTVTSNSVPVTWTLSSSNDVVNYEVAYSSDGGNQYTVASALVNASSTAYTVDGLNPSTAYIIRVVAIDGAGNRSTPVTVNATTSAAADTTPPTVTASPAGGTYSATQTVTLSSNETATIYYTLDGTVPTVGSSVYSSPISVTATETIKYLVVDTAGNQTTGSAIYTIDTVAPDPVTSLTVGTVTSNSIPVTWTAPTASDVSKYEVAYSSDGGTTYIIATSSLTAPATSYTVTGLTASTTYTIRVVAIDGAGNRSAATTVLTTTSAPANIATPVVYPENGYLVMPVNQFAWSGASASYNTDSNFLGMQEAQSALSALFDSSTTPSDPIVSTAYPYKPFIDGMPSTSYPYECITIATSGSFLGKLILKVSTTHGATATAIATYLSNSSQIIKIKLATGYKTFLISSNISNVTTRTATTGFDYFKCTLNDGIGTYVSPPGLLDQFFASNGYEVLAANGFVWSGSIPSIKINSDSTLEMLLPTGILTGGINATSVTNYLSNVALKIYYA